ncbi:MAG: restriction endonuclease subunit S [Burkholderiales bacterium]
MSPERLLAHFDRISEAPGAIPHLRRFILDLAVRGKLVEQDPKDEPASKLLKRIQTEKARLAKEGNGRKDKPSVPLLDDDLPFSVPAGWQWSQLATIGFISPRNDVDGALLASFVPMTLIPAEYGSSHLHEVRPWHEIKSGYTHFAEGDVGLAKITPCFENGKSTVFRGLTGGIGAGTTELHIVRPLLIDADYVLLFLKCPHFIETGIPRMTGTAGQKRVSSEYFAYSPFPLPPHAEQQRIVAKVDELMALCDRLEAAQAERKSWRDRVAAASLYCLNNGADVESFREHARFHLRHLPRLTTRPEHIQQLRQAVLNLAVRGKLVEQNPHDEPASELLKRIQAEKEKLTPQRKDSKDQLPPVEANEMPFEIPPGWAWARLIDVSAKIHYGYTASANPRTDGVRLLRITDIQNNRVNWSSVPGCEITTDQTGQYLLAVGDILIARTGGTIGKSFLVEEVSVKAVFASYLIRVQRLTGMYDRYLKFFLESPVYWKQLDDGARGGGQPNVNGQTLGKMTLTIPPLNEQKRIAAKVTELMALCDELDAQLINTATLRRQLLEATLSLALAA